MNDVLIPLVLAATIAWFFVAMQHPRLAVWALMLWVPIQGWLQLNVFNDSNRTVLIYEFQILGIYLIFAIRALKSPDQFGPPAMIRWAVPFVVWTLLLVPYSVAETGPILTLVGLRAYLLPLPLVWIGYRAFATRRQLELVTALLMLQLVLIAGVTASQYASLSSLGGAIFRVPTGYFATWVIRPPGTFSAPAHLGNYILFSVPFAIGLLGLNAAWWKRVCFALGLASATVALFTNTQRAVFVLLAIVLPLIAVVARRRRAVLSMALAFVIIVIAGSAVGNRIARGALQLRIATISEDWTNTLVLNPRNSMADAMLTPVLGGGLGVASPGAGRLETGSGIAADIRGTAIKFGESFVVALVYETGVPGLLLFSMFFGAVLYHTWRTQRACRWSDAGLLLAAMFAYQVAILLYSWPYGPLHTPPARVLFWFWAGVAYSLPRLMETAAVSGEPVAAAPTDRRARVPVRRPVPVGLPAARRRAV